ncbi:hypothetical protein D9M69_688290 [compost metagenome]
MSEATPARSGGALPTTRSVARVNTGARPSEETTALVTIQARPPCAGSSTSMPKPSAATPSPPPIT